MMNLAMDDYTRVILTQTLCFEWHHAKHAQQGVRTFTDYLMGWMLAPELVVAVHVNAQDVEVDEETGLAVAKEIGWGWKQAAVEIRDTCLSEPIFTFLGGASCGARPPANLKNHWFDTHVRVAEKPCMVGALINHGTIREPQWESHS